ncbi:hypothetical protein DdX_07724 [Ditylenchus destructor]|uniref:Uncharacterized protein n=1 Tax=Ditylenchus destructor TaxID=166010 RepID=A0AAD4N6J5_9BILA|nr:hypothetical protein DdX_07724 [Ditylenchus destructor]
MGSGFHTHNSELGFSLCREAKRSLFISRPVGTLPTAGEVPVLLFSTPPPAIIKPIPTTAMAFTRLQRPQAGLGGID